MRIMSVALVLASLTLCGAASARHHRRTTYPLGTPVATSDPFWRPDYNIIPRYRYRPEDDRVDTSGFAKPVVPSEPQARSKSANSKTSPR
jgi:hypothetical protein